MIGLPNPLDLLGKFNPFGIAGDAVGRVAADGWTGIMLSLWSAGLWVLRFALQIMDQFLTPDISADGPAAGVYTTTFWGAGTLVLIMALVQLGVAAFRRDGKSLARVLIGVAQFAMVWAAWVTYGVAVLSACGGLTRALMKSLLQINAWSEWNPMPDHDFGKGSVEVALATVLGILGLFLWVAAVGHFIVMLTRAAALLILTAVTPIAAAGLVSETGRSWLWKSVRWFHAAALTPVLCVLVMGMGIKLTTGVAQRGTDSAEAAVGTAFPGVMLILISVVAPVALFKLLAFVDPGTSSGAAMRAGMESAGGLQGLLGGGGQQGGTTSAASTGTSSGQSQGEAQSNQATAGRFGSAMSALGGGAGSLASAGMGMVTSVGSAAASVGIDEMNQTGVGDSSYFPDYQRGGQRFNPDQRDEPGGDAAGKADDDPSASTPGVTPPHLPSGPTGSPAGGGSSGGSAAGGGAAGGGAAGGGASGGAAAAGAVPPVV